MVVVENNRIVVLVVVENLTNRMWFSVVCTLIDNDTRHHSGQNVVDSRGATNLKDNEGLRRKSLLNTDLKVHALHYANELFVRVILSCQKLLQTRSTYRNNTKKRLGNE